MLKLPLLSLSRTTFQTYMSDGLYQSTVVFFMPYIVWSSWLSISWTGRVIDSLSDFGTTVAYLLFWQLTVMLGWILISELPYILPLTRFWWCFLSWTIMTWIVVVGSTLVMLLWIFILFRPLISTTFWSTMFLTVTVCPGTALLS